MDVAHPASGPATATTIAASLNPRERRLFKLQFMTFPELDYRFEIEPPEAPRPPAPRPPPPPPPPRDGNHGLEAARATFPTRSLAPAAAPPVMPDAMEGAWKKKNVPSA